MSARQRDAGNAQRIIKGIAVRDAGNTKRTIKTGKIRDAGNVLRIFFQSLTMVITPLTGDIKAIKSTQGASKTVSTGPQALNIVGGVAPITYLWSRVSGSAAIGLDSTTIVNPTFSASMAPDTELVATWKCVVTDAAGATLTVTRTITLQLVFVDTSGTA